MPETHSVFVTWLKQVLYINLVKITIKLKCQVNIICGPRLEVKL